MERRRAPGPLHGVDVRLDQERRLVLMLAGLAVRDRDEPDVPSLERRTDGLDAAKLRSFVRPRAQRVGELVVAVEVVVRDGAHVLTG